jgi:hypothetical protein
MPRLIEPLASDSIELGELVEQLETSHFDAEDEESIASFGPVLARLGNNRTFLADLVIEELKQRCSDQVARNQYGPQVILLHGSSRNFLIRANFWPATSDSVVVNSGTDPFFYDLPHDHNFSFLTVGYLGPGYWSDYYEYDYGSVVGFPGEKVDLKFVERSCLSEGKVMLYRRHLDVHRQLPPDSLSVSLNILATSPVTEFRDQYRFDVDKGEIGSILNPSALATLVRIAAHFGGENGKDLLEGFARTHPSDRIRWSALRARAGAEPTLDGRLALFAAATSSPSRLVSAMAKREVEKLEAGRTWIETPPAYAVRETA